MIFGGAQAEPAAVRIDLGRFWDSQAEAAALTEALARAGFSDSAEVSRLLLELRASALVRKLDEPGRRRLQALLPALLAEIARSERAAAGAAAGARHHRGDRQTLGCTSRCCARAAPPAGAWWSCAGHGDFLAAQIAAYPLLLDELIDERLLSQLPTRAGLAHELTERMEQLREDDPEQQVEALRQFQRAALFRVAVADLTGLLPLMQVSDRLTDIAELIVARAMQLGWRQITAQFGVPMCGGGRAASGEHLRGGLRQARRHGARILLGPRSGFPARFRRASARKPAARGPSTISCSSCASRSASCTC